mmetsp:Transcript_2887/g.6819  ORF Transcript_2887/g.6819 Transcript_2887/m.6819 type:complete len:106 (+) Transcript_2887:2295-2612(+)
MTEDPFVALWSGYLYHHNWPPPQFEIAHHTVALLNFWQYNRLVCELPLRGDGCMQLVGWLSIGWLALNSSSEKKKSWNEQRICSPNALVRSLFPDLWSSVGSFSF